MERKEERERERERRWKELNRRSKRNERKHCYKSKLEKTIKIMKENIYREKEK